MSETARRPSMHAIHDRAATRVFWLGLGAAVLVALLARLWQFQESLWLDELHTAWVASGPASSIRARAALGNHSPCYFVLCWLIASATGSAEIALRLPSLVAGTALLCGAACTVLRWTGSVTASLTAAVLIALDSNCIFYAQEARPYALVQLAALLHLVCAFRATMDGSRRWRAGMMVSAVLLFWLHYTSALLIAGVAAGITAIKLGQPSVPYRWRAAAGDQLIILLACLAALPHVLTIFARRQNWHGFIGRGSPWEALDWFQVVPYLAAPLLGYAAVRAGLVRDRQPPRAARHAWPLVAAWLLAPLLLAWGLTTADVARLFYRRYLLGVAVAPILLAALWTARLPNRRGRAAVAAATLACSLFAGGIVPQIIQAGRVLPPRNQDWRGATAWLDARSRPPSETPLLLYSGLIEADHWFDHPDPLRRDFCLLPVLGPYSVERRRDLLSALPSNVDALPRVVSRQTLRRAETIELLVNGSPATQQRVLGQLRRRLEQAGFAVASVESRRFGTVLAVRLHRGPRPSPAAPGR